MKKPKKPKAGEEAIKSNEQVRVHDGTLIINYEVPEDADEEVVYHGGVRGIRALR